MLFHSLEFIFVFLPTVYLAYIVARKNFSQDISWLILVCASLFFYAWWSYELVFLLIASVLINYYLSGYIRRVKHRWVVIGGVAFNLGLLGYFKYANFFMEQLAWISNTRFDSWDIILPIGISFFTFQQIAYLLDCSRGLREDDKIHEYFLFVTFFPQLIAGPIVHHEEMMPQFEKKVEEPFGHLLIAGLTLFSFGFFKKTFLADGAAQYTQVFDYASGGGTVTFLEAWGGAVAYTFQIYFDFSGYSDMATGLALMFGIRLPINFNSPYKARSFVDFWKRWHITLSRFLRDYVYIPLGGNRCGRVRQTFNFFVTMLLGGLWHGANWTFVLWGAFHAVMISANHIWFGYRKRQEIKALPGVMSLPLTFIFVVLSWVLFRAADLDGLLEMYKGMVGMNGIAVPYHYEGAFPFLAELGIDFTTKEVFFYGIDQVLYLLFMLGIVWFMPSNLQIMSTAKPTVDMLAQSSSRLLWQPNTLWAIVAGLAFVIALLSSVRLNAFLYFQF